MSLWPTPPPPPCPRQLVPSTTLASFLTLLLSHLPSIPSSSPPIPAQALLLVCASRSSFHPAEPHLEPTLATLSRARDVTVAFCPSADHVRVYVAHVLAGPERRAEVLAVWRPALVHASAAGLSRTLAVVASPAWRYVWIGERREALERSVPILEMKREAWGEEGDGEGRAAAEVKVRRVLGRYVRVGTRVDEMVYAAEPRLKEASSMAEDPARSEEVAGSMMSVDTVEEVGESELRQVSTAEETVGSSMAVDREEGHDDEEREPKEGQAENGQDAEERQSEEGRVSTADQDVREISDSQDDIL